MPECRCALSRWLYRRRRCWSDRWVGWDSRCTREVRLRWARVRVFWVVRRASSRRRTASAQNIAGASLLGYSPLLANTTPCIVPCIAPVLPLHCPCFAPHNNISISFTRLVVCMQVEGTTWTQLMTRIYNHQTQKAFGRPLYDWSISLSHSSISFAPIYPVQPTAHPQPISPAINDFFRRPLLACPSCFLL